MTDREKVMTGLELCTNISQDGCLMLCPYKDEKDETYSGFCEQVLKQDALVLLKKQEAVAPKQIIRKQCKKEHEDGSIDYFAEWYCPHCNMLILRGFDNPSIKFCYKCGKPILWEGR